MSRPGESTPISGRQLPCQPFFQHGSDLLLQLLEHRNPRSRLAGNERQVCLQVIRLVANNRVRFHKVLSKGNTRPSTIFRTSHFSAAEFPVSVPPLGDYRGRNGRRGRQQPSCKSLSNQLENRLPVFNNRLQPREPPHLREINSPETQPRNQNIDPVSEWLVPP